MSDSLILPPPPTDAVTMSFTLDDGSIRTVVLTPRQVASYDGGRTIVLTDTQTAEMMKP
jgi:hypothetical protein